MNDELTEDEQDTTINYNNKIKKPHEINHRAFVTTKTVYLNKSASVATAALAVAAAGLAATFAFCLI